MSEIENQKPIMDRLKHAKFLLDAYRGRTVSQAIAKRIYKASKGLYNIKECRLNDRHSLVSMQIAKGLNEYNQPEFFFLVKGRLGKKLNMCD